MFLVEDEEEEEEEDVLTGRLVQLGAQTVKLVACNRRAESQAQAHATYEINNSN